MAMTDMDSRTEDRQASTGPSSESLKAQPATDLGVQSEGRKLIWSSPSYVSDDKEELQHPRHEKSKRPIPGNHMKSKVTALSEDLFAKHGSLGKVSDLLGDETVAEMRKLIVQAQATALSALTPLLKALDLVETPTELAMRKTKLAGSSEKVKQDDLGKCEMVSGTHAKKTYQSILKDYPKYVEECRKKIEAGTAKTEEENFIGYVTIKEDEEKLRNARAGIRDAIAYFMFAQMLGIDSKPDFNRILRIFCPEEGSSSQPEPSQDDGKKKISNEVMSSQMQNAYIKLVRNLQEWLVKTDASTGDKKEKVIAEATTGGAEPKKTAKRAGKSKESFTDQGSAAALASHYYPLGVPGQILQNEQWNYVEAHSHPPYWPYTQAFYPSQDPYYLHSQLNPAGSMEAGVWPHCDQQETDEETPAPSGWPTLPETLKKDVGSPMNVPLPRIDLEMPTTEAKKAVPGGNQRQPEERGLSFGASWT